jgi:hypothetical protein
LLGFSADWRDACGWAIKLGTLSSLTHVAGVAHVDAWHLEAIRDRLPSGIWRSFRPRRLVIESTTLCRWPCELQGRPVNGVQCHDPYSRIGTYPGRVWLYRPTLDWPIDPEKSERLTNYLVRHVGDRYDLAGALASASRVLKHRWWYRPANLHALFCSALWDAALQHIDVLAPEDYSVVNPATLLRTLVKIGRYELVGQFVRSRLTTDN